MRKLTSLMATAAITALLAGTPLIAFAQTATDPHHAADQAGGQQAAPAAEPGTTPAPGVQPGMMGALGAQPGAALGNMPMMANMMGMMANMMAMMSAMGQGGSAAVATMPCGPGMAGAAASDHLDGRIAFLRAEIAITDAQAAAWSKFADALRQNAKKVGEVRSTMMMPAIGGSSQATTPMARLEREEHSLSARLDGVRVVREALEGLYGVLSPEQKKTADELLTSPMGPMPMGPMGPMAMMPSTTSMGAPQP